MNHNKSVQTDISGAALADVVIMWTPAIETFANIPTAGQVFAARQPVRVHFALAYTHSAGADGFGWRQMKDATRAKEFEKLTNEIVRRDGIAKDAILLAVRCALWNESDFLEH